MYYCGHCGGEVMLTERHIREQKHYYHPECYSVKRYWEEQEEEQSEMVRKSRESGL